MKEYAKGHAIATERAIEVLDVYSWIRYFAK